MPKKIIIKKVKPIQIIHGDCLDGLKSLADNSIDLLITDPPYFIDKLNTEMEP